MQLEYCDDIFCDVLHHSGTNCQLTAVHCYWSMLSQQLVILYRSRCQRLIMTHSHPI